MLGDGAGWRKVLLGAAGQGACSELISKSDLGDRTAFLDAEPAFLDAEPLLQSPTMQAKLDFFHDARRRPSPCKDAELDAAVASNLQWVAGQTPEEVIAQRERIIVSIEKLAEHIVQSGQCEAWFASADAATRKVASGVNGPLLQHLAEITQYKDAECVEMFRSGAQMSGVLRETCNGKRHNHGVPESVAAFEASCENRNARLLSSLSTDKNAAKLLAQMHDEAVLGWLSTPVRCSEADVDGETSYARRFSVEQFRPDGTAKIRAVDDYSESGLNPTVLAQIKLANDSVECIELAIKALKGFGIEQVKLWKADVKSAYRRMPVRLSDRRFLGILLRVGKDIWMSKHLAAPFGAVGSVYEWDRLGNFLCHLGIKLLMLPVFRYVDDYFSAEPSATAEHAMSVFERLFACVLGPGTMAKEKLEAGLPLDVLGVSIDIVGNEVRVQLSEEKREKWRRELEEVLLADRLNSSRALKIAGKLSFAAVYSFMGIGRTMLWSVFREHYDPSRCRGLSVDLREALSWWVNALSSGFPRTIVLGQPMEVVEMFCDARSSPPRLSAVVCAGGYRGFTDWEPDELTMRQFEKRRDGQITSLELLAVALGLATFSSRFTGRMVRVWVDNTGCEHMTRRQSGRSKDHNDLVRAMWMSALRNRHGLWVERVGTHDNIADDPSREDYASMQVLGAEWVMPFLEPALLRPAMRL